MNIYLIRHGETDWNKMQKIQGREDIELNETGIKQAEECGQAFRNLKIDMIISSPLKRARKTAGIIGSNVGINNIIIEDDLIERDFGRLSGLSFSEIENLKKSGRPLDIEDFSDLCSRIKGVLDKYGALKNIDNIIMVSHGAAINSILALLSDHKIGSGITRLKNTCINILEFINDEIKIKQYNLGAKEFIEVNKTGYSFSNENIKIR